MYKEWTIKDLLNWTSNFFRDKGIEEPRLEAEVLLARVLNKDRVYLYANYDLPVNSQEREQYRDFVKRRAQGEPSAYITGSREFMSLNLKVNPDVLIPRSDTEILVESVIDVVNKDEKIRICDVGTGSGAIAISLAYYLPNSVVYATDISEKALEVAQENAQNNNVEVNFLLGNLLTPIKQASISFDVITANLPYIPPHEFEQLDKGVKDFEPTSALVAQGDGLDLYRELIPQAYELIAKDGYLFFEIGYNQGDKAIDLVRDFTEVELIKDLAGRDRVIKARKG